MTSPKCGAEGMRKSSLLCFSLSDRQGECVFMYSCGRAWLLNTSPGSRTLEFSAAAAGSCDSSCVLIVSSSMAA